MSVGERELPAVQATDLALVLVRAEGRIDEAEPVEHALEDVSVDLVVANVDGDGHPHDLLDAPDAGNDHCRGAQTFLSSTSAACSD